MKSENEPDVVRRLHDMGAESLDSHSFMKLEDLLKLICKNRGIPLVLCLDCGHLIDSKTAPEHEC